MPQCGFGRTDLQVSAFCLGTMTLDLQSNAMRRGQTGPEPLEPGTWRPHSSAGGSARQPNLGGDCPIGRDPAAGIAFTGVEDARASRRHAEAPPP